MREGVKPNIKKVEEVERVKSYIKEKRNNRKIENFAYLSKFITKFPSS